MTTPTIVIARTRYADSYGALRERYGKEAFARACAEAKWSPLSLSEILERDAEKAHSIARSLCTFRA